MKKVGLKVRTTLESGVVRRRSSIAAMALLVAAAVWFTGSSIVSQWARVHTALAAANAGLLATGVALAAVAMLLIADGWRRTLGALLQEPLSNLAVQRWYFVGEIGKYVPGGVWPLLGRGEMARRGGVPRTAAYASVALSLCLLYLSGLLVAACTAPLVLSSGAWNRWTLLLVLVPVGFLALRPPVLVAAASVVARIARRPVVFPVLPWRTSAALVIGYVPAWLIVGASTWCTARALTPDAPVARVVFAAVLGWCAGFLAVPIPSGLGVREAVMSASSGLPKPIGALTALASRFMFTLVDVVAALACLRTVRHRGRAAEPRLGVVSEERAP